MLMRATKIPVIPDIHFSAFFPKRESDTGYIMLMEQINTTHLTVLHSYNSNLSNNQVLYTVTYAYEQCSDSQQTTVKGKLCVAACIYREFVYS